MELSSNVTFQCIKNLKPFLNEKMKLISFVFSLEKKVTAGILFKCGNFEKSRFFKFPVSSELQSCFCKLQRGFFSPQRFLGEIVEPCRRS